MSSDEEDSLCRFGTPLDPIEEGNYFAFLPERFSLNAKGFFPFKHF